jgi:hypothetical protein
MSRYVYVSGIALIVLALAFRLTDSLLSRALSGVTASNVQRIRVGSTLAEVQALLGRPANEERLPSPSDRGGLAIGMSSGVQALDSWVCVTSLKTVLSAGVGPGTFTDHPYSLTLIEFGKEPSALRAWHGRTGVAEVLFDHQGRVQESKFWPR